MKKEAQKVLKYRNGGGVGWAGMGSAGGWHGNEQARRHRNQPTGSPSSPGLGHMEQRAKELESLHKRPDEHHYVIDYVPGGGPKPEIDRSLSGEEMFKQIFGRAPGSLWTERDKSFGQQIEKENKIAEMLGSDKPPHLMVIPRGGYSEEDIMAIQKWKATPVRDRVDIAVNYAESFVNPPMESEFADVLNPQASMPPIRPVGAPPHEDEIDPHIDGIPVNQWGAGEIGSIAEWKDPIGPGTPGWKDNPNNPANFNRRQRTIYGPLGRPTVGKYEDLYEDAKWGWDYETGKHTGDAAAYELFDPYGIYADHWKPQEIGAPQPISDPGAEEPSLTPPPGAVNLDPAVNWEAKYKALEEKYNKLQQQFRGEVHQAAGLREQHTQLLKKYAELEQQFKDQPRPPRPGLIDALQKPWGSVISNVSGIQPKPPGSNRPTIFMGDHPSGQTEWQKRPDRDPPGYNVLDEPSLGSFKPKPKPKPAAKPWSSVAGGIFGGRPNQGAGFGPASHYGAVGSGIADSSWGGRFAEGGEVEDWREDLDKELEGMGEEGKSYLKDKLHGKEYKGELSFEDQRDLDKEIDGLSPEGKEYLKEKLGDSDPFKEFKKKLNVDKDEDVEDIDVEDKKDEDEESIGELMAYSEEGYAKGGEAKNWIKGAVKKPGALRAVAKKDKLIKGDEKLSGSDLKKLAALASKKDNKLLAKRVALAKTFAKMRK